MAGVFRPFFWSETGIIAIRPQVLPMVTRVQEKVLMTTQSDTDLDQDFLTEHKESLFGKAGHAAQLVCIAFAFLAPSLLVWQVLLK